MSLVLPGQEHSKYLNRQKASQNPWTLIAKHPFLFLKEAKLNFVCLRSSIDGAIHGTTKPSPASNVPEQTPRFHE